MDDKQLRQFLEEVAHVVDGNCIGPNGRLDKRLLKKQSKIITEVITNEFGEEEEVEVEVSDYNETLGYSITGLKDNYRVCEIGCGAVVPNQVIEKKLVTTPIKHWRTHCKACHKTRAPDGTMMSSPQAQQAYIRHFNSKQDK
jgi:predicted chitinase